MAYLNDARERFKLGHASATPFQSTAKGHFETFGLEWCPRCKMVVDCDTKANHHDTMYMWTRRCQRCGKAISYGAYNNVPIVGEPTWSQRRLMRNTIEFITEPGIDRRTGHGR